MTRNKSATTWAAGSIWAAALVQMRTVADPAITHAPQGSAHVAIRHP